MSKKSYQINENLNQVVVTVGLDGKQVTIEAGETFETSDPDVQRELDAQVAIAGSGIKAAKASDKKDDK